jgi:predicted metalloprotease with PDZ domain
MQLPTLATTIRWLVAPAVLFAALYLEPRSARAEDSLTYRASYNLATPALVHVTLVLPGSAPAPVALIMPRAVPGAYAQRAYDPFVLNVRANSADDAWLEVRREEFGPRWSIGKTGEQVKRVEYDIAVARMEHEILAASDSSRIRDGYVGLLGYSIFAFLEGHENEPIRLEVSGPPDWPVFSTLAPHVPTQTARLTSEAADYYALADSQVLMGPKLQLQQIAGRVPLFLSAYAEASNDLQQEGALAREALDKVFAYFGKAPFAHYTVVLELLRPLSDRHQYNFSIEHLDSGTFYFDTGRALAANASERERETHRFNYAHHIAHSWIPKHAYGTGYLPFTWEMAPIIDTIWFNEGFGRYVAVQALADAMPSKEEGARYRKEKLDRLQGIVDAAPAFIRRMALPELSREGSFLYSEDFRVAQNLFARGSLMAAEMDDSIRAQTGGQKSLREALRYLIDWTARNRRAFRAEELPAIFRQVTGVDTTAILNRRMQPLP